MAHTGTGTLTIGQVSERTGLSVHALRFYEREGLLLGSVPRTSGGRRAFTDNDVAWLSLCQRFRSCGMPLADIRRYAELVSEGPGNEADRLALLRSHERRVETDLAQLTENLSVIAAKTRLYEQHLAAGDASSLWTRDTPTCLVVEALARRADVA